MCRRDERMGVYRWHGLRITDISHLSFLFSFFYVSESRCVQESEELLINATATINNLSFYQGESSVVRSQHEHISQCKTSACV